jgi:hypothetical protein
VNATEALLAERMHLPPATPGRRAAPDLFAEENAEA